MPGKYEVVGTLATGGMAEILLARVSGAQGFSRAVALKRIRSHLLKNPAFRTMFLDEARLMAGIHHPNVVNVHELYDAGDELFLVMDYLQGETAAALLRAASATETTLPPALMAYVVAEAASGLHAAHELTGADGEPLGLVHRDVSPSNIFITYDGHVRLLDFGIAHAVGRSTETEAGQIKGKFSYMSPEQCRGKPLDRRSDVFALGVVLYELTTHSLLFKRPTDMETMRAVCKGPIPDAQNEGRGCPPALARICHRALARDRNVRHGSAEEMELELRRFVHGATSNPRLELAEWMQKFFAERVETKQRWLRSVRTGGPVLEPTEVDAFPDVEVPTVAPAGAPADTNVERSSGGRLSWVRQTASVGLAFAVLSAAGVAAVQLTQSADPAHAPSDEDRVTVAIETDPAGAQVTIGGRARGVSPTELQLPRSDAALELSLTLPDHEPLLTTLVPSVSQRLQLRLDPIQTAEAAAPTTATPPTTSSAPTPAHPPPGPVRPAPPPSPSSPAAPSSESKGIYRL